MKRFLLLLLPFLSFGQSPDCDLNTTYQVIAPSGLRMRAEPKLTAKPVVSVPKDSLVNGCMEAIGELEVEEIVGHWRYVEYKGKKGYMFDGFLQTLPPPPPVVAPVPEEQLATDEAPTSPPAPAVTKPAVPQRTSGSASKQKIQLATEVLNFCGDIAQLDPGLLWYGMYFNEETQRYVLRPIQMELVVSKYKLGNKMEFDIRTGNDESAAFLVGSNQKLSTGEIVDLSQDFWQFSPRMLFPGQRIEIYPSIPGKGPDNLKIQALGSILSAGDCPEIADYKIIITGKKGVVEYTQNLSEQMNSLDRCAIPEIYWFGDLNQDNKPDLILVTQGENQSEFTLFLSVTEEGPVLLQKSSTWTVEKCY